MHHHSNNNHIVVLLKDTRPRHTRSCRRFRIHVSFFVLTLLLLFTCSTIGLPVVQGWGSMPLLLRRHDQKVPITLHMNLLYDLGDMMTGGKLVPQQGVSLPYGAPLLMNDDKRNNNQRRTFAIQERFFSLSGEDFDVSDLDNGGESYVRVRGAMLHLPGKDKMRITDCATSTVVASLERKLLALQPTYDIYRGDGLEKIGWLEKAMIAFTDTFLFHAEAQKGGFGPFAAPPAFRLEGDFLDRRFVIKNVKNEVVAKVTKDQLVEFDAFNHYQVQVAPGMDAVLVLACACAIDEEFDEEHRERAQREKEK